MSWLAMVVIGAVFRAAGADPLPPPEAIVLGQGELNLDRGARFPWQQVRRRHRFGMQLTITT
jgi:hypothetical protein